MKKAVIFLLIMTSLLIGCSLTHSDATSKPIENQSSPITSEEEAQKRAEEIFKQIKEAIENGKYASGGKELEDLAKEYPENVSIATYEYFDSANFWLNNSDTKTTSDESYVKFEENLALININFDGEYSDFIIDYMKTNMGIDRYNELHHSSLVQKESFDGMSEADRIAVLVYIHNEEDKIGDNITGKQADAIWAEACKKYGITESDIMTLMMDTELVRKSYASNNNTTNVPSTDVVTEYDATLVYGSGSVAVAISKEAMDNFFDALVNDNDAGMQELYNGGQIADTPSGTKVAILDSGITEYKVKLLDGLYAGNTVWVIAEAINKK